MLGQLKEKVYQANLDLPKHGPVKYIWGDVSVFDPETRYFIIKPSGVSYEEMTADDMVVMDLDNHIIEGKPNPSSDTPIHAVLYRSLPQIGGIIHTYSTWAMTWTQVGLDVPAIGKTHAGTFYGSVPCTRFLA